MHTIKLLLTYYLNISVQAANLSDCRIESNRKKNLFGSENRIETFLPELECSTADRRLCMQQLIDISWPPRLQQQTRSIGVRWPDGTDA